jgi:hypothetical protein
MQAKPTLNFKTAGQTWNTFGTKMTKGSGTVVRILADLFVACLAPLAIFASSRTGSANGALAIGVFGAQLIAVGVMA